jgi:hypothetical protein
LSELNGLQRSKEVADRIPAFGFAGWPVLDVVADQVTVRGV